MRTTLATLTMLVAPRIALACPVCFGATDSPLAVAMNTGIIFMLVVVAGMLASFAAFFIYLMRRARLAAAQADTAEHGRYLEGQEGTAQC
jgi:predicted transporter